MRVRLLDELWVTQTEDGTFEIGVPTVRRRGGFLTLTDALEMVKS